jgi:predicted PurR-regulated permease PerM
MDATARTQGDPARLRPPTPRVALLLTAAVVLAVALYLGRDALGPFIVGLLFVFLLDPFVERLARLRLPRWLAVIVVYGVAIFVIIEALNLTLQPLVAQVRAFIDALPDLITRLQAQLDRLGAVYRGLELPPAVRDAVDQWIRNLRAGNFGFDPGIIMPILRATTGFLTAVLGFLVVPVWSFYLLKDRPVLAEAFDRSLPSEWRADVKAVLGLVERVFRQWIRGQLVLGLAVGIATFGGLLVLAAAVDPIFGRYAILLAVIAGIFELLPIIGPILSAIPAILIGATAGLEAAVAAFLLYLAIQQIENTLLVPKIQGDAVELHPSVVILALIVGGSIAGLLGAILALPVTAALRDVYRYLFRRLSAPEAVPTPPGVHASMTAPTRDPESPDELTVALPEKDAPPPG